jgi:nitrogen fixation/metabolism regulation signal transduction histidine kinase
MFGGIWYYLETELIVSPIGFGVVTLVQGIALIYYINRSRNELLKFFRGVDLRDFSKNYQEHFVGSQDELKSAFNSVLETFRKLNLEKEEQYQYLRLVNKEVPIGIMSFDEKGKIDLYNPELCKLLRTPVLGQLHQLSKFEPELVNSLISGEKEQWVFNPRDKSSQYSVKKRTFELSGQSLFLITIQDISSELEEREIDAFQKLIRVLTHEIMNSVTPVVSLTTAIRMMMEENGNMRQDSFDKEELNDLYKSVLSIEKRGQGLMGFIKAYRSYTKPMELDKTEVYLAQLLDNVIQLCSADLEGIQLHLDLQKDHVLELDEKLLSQVIINLLKNAAQATQDTPNPEIRIVMRSDTSIQLSVSDNGPGIPNDIRRDIFVPFFTTKKEGSGIGLSLSKQIMKAHGGDLKLIASDQGSEFVLSFSTPR